MIDMRSSPMDLHVCMLKDWFDFVATCLSETEIKLGASEKYLIGLSIDVDGATFFSALKMAEIGRERMRNWH